MEVCHLGIIQRIIIIYCSEIILSLYKSGILRAHEQLLGINCIDTYKNKKYENYFDSIIVNDYEILENEEFINDIHKYFNKESGRVIVKLDAYYLDIEYFDISQIKHIQNELLKNRLDMKKIYKAQDKDKVYSVNMCFELSWEKRI